MLHNNDSVTVCKQLNVVELYFDVFLVDGTNDSPGHWAQYCSYTTVENDTEIIHVSTKDKQQTSCSSVVVEKEGFIQTVDKLASERKLVEICTDAHVQIGALMSKY